MKSMKWTRCIIAYLTFISILLPQQIYGQPWVKHGTLKVSDNGHYLVHEDGTGFFWLGCTAWMLPRLSPEDVDRYLIDRKNKGFTVIQFTSNNMGRPNYRGELPFLGDEGRPWKTVTLNESYWNHIDFIIDRAGEMGLYTAVFVWWGSDAGDPSWKEGRNSRMHFRDPDKQNFEFGRFLGERYNDRPNIIWVGSGEYHKPVAVMFPDNQRPLTDQHRERLVDVIRGIRETEKGNHLYTIHPVSFLSSSEEFHQADWLDFNMIQSHAVPEFIVPLTHADWNLKPAKPTFNSEGWYENEHQLYSRWTDMRKVEDRPVDEGWKQRYQAYWSVFAGGFGFTYGHKNLWRMEDLEGNPGILKQEVLDAPGSSSLIYLRKLIESKPILSRIPDPLLISSGTTGRDGGLSPDLRIATRDLEGYWAFIYSTRGSLIRVRMDRLASGKVSAYWYDPRNGNWYHQESEYQQMTAFEHGIRSGPGSEPVYFDPPGKSEDGNDWVLVLELQSSDKK